MRQATSIRLKPIPAKIPTNTSFNQINNQNINTMKSIISILAGLFIFVSAGTATAQENLPFEPPSYSNDLMMDNQTWFFLIADRLEYALTDGVNPIIFDIQGFVGKEYNKFWFKAEGDMLTNAKRARWNFRRSTAVPSLPTLTCRWALGLTL